MDFGSVNHIFASVRDVTMTLSQEVSHAKLIDSQIDFLTLQTKNKTTGPVF